MNVIFSILLFLLPIENRSDCMPQFVQSSNDKHFLLKTLFDSLGVPNSIKRITSNGLFISYKKWALSNEFECTISVLKHKSWKITIHDSCLPMCNNL